MPAMMDLEKAKREELRWLILRALYAAQPMGTSEVIIKNAIEPVMFDVTTLEVRRELDYLMERGLVTVTHKDTPVWFGKINRYGIDIVEYTIDCDPGISRPCQW
jgi:hypothetical protein